MADNETSKVNNGKMGTIKRWRAAFFLSLSIFLSVLLCRKVFFYMCKVSSICEEERKDETRNTLSNKQGYMLIKHTGFLHA